jgi:phage protein D
LDRQLLDFGKAIEIVLGPSDMRRTLFEGAITAIEVDFAQSRDAEIVIFAEDKLMDLRMTRRSKTYEQVSDADVATQIAQQHGLSPDVQAQGPTYDVLQQWNQSDLAFLRERARRIAAEVWIDGQTLSFKKRDARNPTQLTLVRGNHLLEVQIRADLADQRTKVKVSGFDASRRELIDEEATNDAVQAEISGGDTGPRVLSDKFGERVSYRVGDVPLVDAEARDWAEAEMLLRARGFVTAVGVTDGSSDMVVGSEITLEDVGAMFEGGGYYVTRVLHSFDVAGEGHRTRFEAQRSTIAEAR